jgi:hypothetical protein
MKQTTLRFGLYAGITICSLMLIAWYVFSDLSMGSQEVLGYASMIVALLFVYFGVRHYREQENNGTLRFAEGLRIGLGITLIAALCFGILDVIYVKWMNPGFMEEYYANVLTEMESTLPAGEFLERKREMESQKELFTNPLINFLVMFFTVFLIGLIISLISALLLRRKAGNTV